MSISTRMTRIFASDHERSVNSVVWQFQMKALQAAGNITHLLSCLDSFSKYFLNTKIMRTPNEDFQILCVTSQHFLKTEITCTKISIYDRTLTVTFEWWIKHLLWVPSMKKMVMRQIEVERHNQVDICLTHKRHIPPMSLLLSRMIEIIGHIV